MNTYWVRFIHVELLGFPPSLQANSSIKVGDKVRVKATISTPRYKWGYITHDCIGVVTGEYINNGSIRVYVLKFTAIAPNGHDVTVDFPKQENWTGLLSEMELVPSSHDGITCGGCTINPIKGTRFKCKVCENFDYCENCFYTKKGHIHAFSRISEVGTL